ncbi:hypothetical protein SAMD00019534_066330 [Acytostelium subglobosum LB1]|uniref:hypothetical protein n=1 Tax=Acytostelium subglobosum LB1 TaxID=1410327 RepID=UPI00064521B0|nr:hypothetical protein SAMD00019534_066330 [Acytostelium subglobosum LB1]GAM23458.1 hypothetical protein SAMD00019534_066330 [Acytostelium subglobosum LB1]|eukprot:XP_012753907.1 hypothetical protein SAMD00019534_066330 [Acytostelium subglobosum LB1]
MCDTLPDGSGCYYNRDCCILSSCLDRVCVARFSVAAGGACLANEDCDIPQNLLCFGFTCQNKDVLASTMCNSTIDCNQVLNFTRCQCDSSASPSIGRCQPIMDPTVLSKNIYYDYNQCLINNKCPKVDSQIPASCSGGKCGNPLTKAFNNPCNSGSGLFSNVHLTFSVLLLAAAMFLL